jgi:hypothetical protein
LNRKAPRSSFDRLDLIQIQFKFATTLFRIKSSGADWPVNKSAADVEKKNEEV